MNVINFPANPLTPTDYSVTNWTDQNGGTWSWSIVESCWKRSIRKRTIGIVNIGIPTLGTKEYLTMSFSGTVVRWSIEANGTSPACVFDVLKIASGPILPTASICGSEKPTISSGNVAASSTLTGWTTSFSEGDIVGFKIDDLTGASSDMSYIKLTLELLP